MSARCASVWTLPLLAMLALGGCMSLSGLSGESKYACKAPDGVTCDSVSGTYANALANNLPGQRRHKATTPTVDTGVRASRPALPPRISTPTAGEASAHESRERQERRALLDMDSALRAPPRYLRLWVKPWEDIDGDLYDQMHVYVQVDQGRWLIDHVQQRIRQAYAPLRPPPTTGSTAPANDSAPRGEATPSTARPAPLLPDLGARISPEVPR